MVKRRFLFAIVLISILMLNLVASQTIVQKTQPVEEEKKTGFFAGFWSTITSPLFLGFFALAILIIIFILLIVWVISKIIKWIKLRSDLFYRLKTERIKLAQNQARYIEHNHWWKIEKNVAIRTIKNNEGGQLTISKPIAYYRGDFYSHEGNLVLAVVFPNRKKWWFFPMTDLIIIPNKKKIEINQGTKEGKPIKTIINNLPTANEIVRFLENEIILFIESISMSGEFFFPVIKDSDGKIIDLALPVYQSLKEVVLEDYLYSQTTSFVDISRKGIDINPYLRIGTKMNDQNSSVELPDANRRIN
jgi:hypothetical protein